MKKSDPGCKSQKSANAALKDKMQNKILNFDFTMSQPKVN